MDRIVFIVRRDRPDLFDGLRKVFSTEPDVQVLLERRARPRRQSDAVHATERRRADRRMRPHADLDLKRRGWTIVRVPIPE